ncbi:hypothetical protein PROFUN_09890 [Planoprotostelium fungivorum]|uniref:E3 ubiquitin-protein ligase CHFR n=1 Tax=Planoprotostelium fungivorum TaxID=1890364 RepID=A0A2P6NGF8_9EUKA|nr:hypothetical protein PROFUN_09890 [Planoprotostelium fungivorum]
MSDQPPAPEKKSPESKTGSNYEDDGCPAHLIRIATVAPSGTMPDVVHLKSKEITIGRQESCNVMISRLHARMNVTIEQDGDGRYKWIIKDNNSVNGLFINDVKRPEAVLEDGDTITFGGGGNEAFGLHKQQPNSEFIYQIRYKKVNHLKRKQPEEDPAVVEAKRIKLAEEEAARAELQAKLQERLAEIEERERKIKEMEEKVLLQAHEHETFQGKMAELQEKLAKNEELVEGHTKSLAETQKQASDLAEKLAEKDKKLAEIKELTENEKKAMEEEFSCIVCQELIMTAMTLECSHSFCQQCLSSWMLTKKMCPYCRTVITKQPIRSRTVDNAIEKFTASLSDQDKIRWNERKKKQEAFDQEEVAVRKITDMINTAKAKQLKFFDITKQWTAEEKRVFAQGLVGYKGRARAVYCQSTGLTRQYIDAVNVIQMRQAAANAITSGDTTDIYNFTSIPWKICGHAILATLCSSFSNASQNVHPPSTSFLTPARTNLVESGNRPGNYCQPRPLYASFGFPFVAARRSLVKPTGVLQHLAVLRGRQHDRWGTISRGTANEHP